MCSLLDCNVRHDLKKQEVKVGRHPHSDVVVTDKRVSSCHLRIYRDDANRFFIEELGSNGCFVNDQCMKKGQTRVLQDGDEISICVLGPSHAPTEPSGPEMQPFAAYLFRTVGGCTSTSSPSSGTKRDSNRYSVTEEWVSSNWDMRVQLGSGNFSVVRLGVKVLGGDKRAVKVLDKSKFRSFQTKRESMLNLEDEASVLAGIDHPNIVRCHEWFQTDPHLYLVLELVEGGDLFQCIMLGGHFPEPQAKRLFLGLCEAIFYLHQRRSIVHRDIKPENVLCTSKDRDTMQPKLGDFGLAKVNMKSRDCRTFCGTPHYFAPEVITSFQARQDGEEKAGYGKQADMWSMGVVLYILLSGNPPFEEEGLYEQIIGGKYEFDVDEWTQVSSEAKDIVARLMTVNPKERLSIVRAMAHPWSLPNGGPAKRRRCGAPPSVGADVSLSIIAKEHGHLGA